MNKKSQALNIIIEKNVNTDFLKTHTLEQYNNWTVRAYAVCDKLNEEEYKLLKEILNER